MKWLLGAFGQRTENPRLAIDTECLHLRLPQLADFEIWRDLRIRSRGFLAPWEPVWPQDDLAPAAFRRRVRRAQEEAELDLGYALLVFAGRSGPLLGGVSLSNIRRRAAQSASLGYWMAADFAGRGVMTEAVGGLARHGFGVLGLERIEAGCLPENRASIRVLEKAGFQREGHARDYLAIAGRRRDHLLFARLKTDAEPVIPPCSLPQKGSALVV